jgi:acetylornithine deacetylase
LPELDAAVAERAEDAFAFLDRLVREPSVLGAEPPVLAVLAAELERLGFELEWVPIDEAVLAQPDAGTPLDPAIPGTSLVARRGGAGGRSLLINGHLDVVPAGPRHLWHTEPFEPVRAGGWMAGRGAGDMKCGFAMAVLALSALDAVHPRAREWPLTIAGVVQEESTGNGTLATLLAGATADAALLVEPTGLELWTGAVGVIWCDITTHGRAAHAMAAGDGASAIASLWPIIQACEDYGLSLERAAEEAGSAERYTVNVGMLSAGEWQSMVPSEARMTVRFGFPSTWRPDRAEAEIRDAIAAAARQDPWMAEHPPDVSFRGMRAQGYHLPADDVFAQTLARTHVLAHGDEPAVVFASGTTDARFYRNRARIPALCYGPRVRNIHAANEAVELQSIVEGARTLARLVPAWCKDG